MIRVGVVEDDAGASERLLAHFDRFERSHEEFFRISTFHDGAAVLANYRPEWDVLVLDIQMPRVDGMTAARRIREVDSEVVIVFVTSSPHYAVSGYEVGALSYLLKPVAYASFEQEMIRICSRLRRQPRRELLVSAAGGELRRIAVDDIRYVESARHRVEIHTLETTLSVGTTLKSIQSQLPARDFIRCHNGILVNLGHVTGIEGNDCRIRGGGSLPISRPRKRDFLAALAEHVGSRGVSA